MKNREYAAAEHFDRVKWRTEEIDRQIDIPRGPLPSEKTVEDAFVEWWKSANPDGSIDTTKKGVGKAPDYMSRWWVP